MEKNGEVEKVGEGWRRMEKDEKDRRRIKKWRRFKQDGQGWRRIKRMEKDREEWRRMKKNGKNGEGWRSTVARGFIVGWRGVYICKVCIYPIV